MIGQEDRAIVTTSKARKRKASVPASVPHRPRGADYLRMACTSANVSFKSALTEDELIHALVTGKVPVKRGPHLRMLFNEAPKAMLQGLAGDVARWTKPGKLERNLRKLASDLGAMHGVERWLKSG